MTEQDDWLVSGIGHCTADKITVCGRDLAEDLMGTVSFPDLAFLLVARRMPTDAESRLFNAVLVALTDHGLTPTVLAARLTYTGAPEALQGAIAAGLLGGGSVFLGPTEDTARFLQAVAAEHQLTGDSPRAALRVAADLAVQACRADRRRVPGLGHPVHKQLDPRVPKLYALATDSGLLGIHLRLLDEIQTAQAELSGRHLPINGAGAAGAALADLGLPAELARGFALLARTAGLLGHLAEERDHPLGMSLYRDVENRMHYRPAP